MYCVGLTGTIASGKSTVIAYFNQLGIDTINADTIAKELTTIDTPALKEIIDHFGHTFQLQTGELNRRLLRQHIMSHPTDKIWLENLLHPLIRKEIERRITISRSQYCIIEIPLLSDRNLYPYLNRVILITAEPEQQIKRLIARDHCSKTEAQKMLAQQEQNNNRATLADDVVLNNSSINELNKQLFALHQKYSVKTETHR